MSIHIDARAARSAASGALPRLLPRTAWWAVALLAAALAAAFAAAAPALAAQPGVTQVSADPYTPATAPSGEHATEVEPDTFAFGSTLVSAFQTGRVFNGGATDIGWATSSDGGVSWTHGFLPGTSREAMQPGPFFSVSDPSVAYDARDRVWIISWLGAHFSGGGIVDVMVSRSTDGGLTWGTPVTMAATGVFYDKNWTACDNTPASPFYGHCYTEFDNASSGDLELMSTSADSGLSWGPPTPAADNIHGLGGQPVVQPNGRVVVPFEGFSGIRAFSSDDGGATWNASVQISTRSSHRVPGVRTLAAALRRDQPRRHSLRRMAGQPLRTRRHRQRHRAQQLGQRHHLVAGQPHPARPGRQQRRPLHPRPRRQPHLGGRQHAARAHVLLRHQSELQRQHLPDTGRIRVLA